MGNNNSQEKSESHDASTTLYNLTFSHVISQYLHVIAKLDVASIIGRAGKPLTAAEIASHHGGSVNVNYLERMLRLLSSTKNVFKEVKIEGDLPAFELTDLSQLLRSDVPGQLTLRYNVMHSCMAATYRAWSHLEECITSPAPKAAFEIETGVKRLEYYKKNPDYAEVFNNAMTELSELEMNTILIVCSDIWKALDKQRAAVLDLGGGHGHAMRKVKVHYPNLRCTVLDQKEVIETAPKEDQGINFVVGDFFKPETLPKADVIFMKRVLLNWDDENSQKILESCYVALKDGGKLIVVDFTLPEIGQSIKPHERVNFIMDASMMICYNSRVRSVADLKNLFQKARFNLCNIVTMPVAVTCWIEAHKI